MTNEIYIPNELSETLQRLSKDEKRRVVRSIDSLGEDVLKNSYVFSGDDSPGGGLRAARAGDLCIIFRYTPGNHTIIVTDVSPMSHQEELAVSA